MDVTSIHSMESGFSPQFDADLVRRYDGRGPRYTSYPTANLFSNDFDADRYREAALAGNSDPIPAPLSVYLHIPFCRSLCYYCGCNKVVTRRAEKADFYLKRLHREIALQGALFDSDRPVNQLHLGGGTPTFLSDSQLATLMDSLRGHFTMAQTASSEYSIEIDPRTVDPARIGHLREIGFNRLSIGIQDFDPAVQAAVNRVQPINEVFKLFERARGDGFRSISVDLIYGLPKQTVARFEQTLLGVIALRPDRISLYSYAHLPKRFKAQRLLDGDALPGAEEKLAIFEHALTAFCEAGYEYIGMDHFALPEDDLVKARDRGDLQRNFQGYSTHADHDLVGLGVSAISSVGNVYCQNAHQLKSYYNLLDQGRLPQVKGLHLNRDDLIRRDAIQRLMCYGRIDLDELDRHWRINSRRYFAPEIERLSPLRKDGLVQCDHDRIALTAKGRLLMRPVAMVFDRYLQQDEPSRFSRVI